VHQLIGRQQVHQAVAGDIGLQQVHQVEQGLAEEAIGRLLLDYGAVDEDAVFGLVYTDLIVMKAEVSVLLG